MLTLLIFFGPFDPDNTVLVDDLDPGILQLEDQGIEMLQLHVADPDIAAGDGRRHHEGAGLDPVRHDPIG